MNYLESITNVLNQELKQGDLFIFGQDIRHWGGQGGFLLPLVKTYDKYIIDTPIAEAATSGIATGLALGGKRVMIEYAFFDFILHSVDQIINNATKLQFFAGNNYPIRMPIVYYVTLHSGRGYGATHSQSLEYIFTNVPNLRVVYPSNPRDAQDLLKEALHESIPTVFITHKLLHSETTSYPSLPSGRARVHQKGKDLCIISYGKLIPMITTILDENYLTNKVTLIDLRYLSTIDYNTLVEYISKTKQALFVEEGPGVIMKQLVADLTLHYRLDTTYFHLLHGQKSAIATNQQREEEVLVSKKMIENNIKKLL